MRRGPVDDPEMRWPSFRKPERFEIEGRLEGPDEAGLYLFMVHIFSDRMNCYHPIRARDTSEAIIKAQLFADEVRGRKVKAVRPRRTPP